MFTPLRILDAMKFTKRFFFLAIMLFFLIYSLYILNHSAYDLSAFSLISNASQQSSHAARLPENDLFDRFLWDRVALVNANQTNVQNENQFSSLNDDGLVIIVQVHKRLEYLRTLIKSLARVKFIESTLVVFSHDHIDDDINRLIAGINFTQVMIIASSLLYILLNILKCLGSANFLPFLNSNLEAHISWDITKRLFTRSHQRSVS